MRFYSVIAVVDSPKCTIDADCPSREACFSGTCKNPCIETKPCGAHATCSVVDSLPLRTMICKCDEGYIGDADVACKLGISSLSVSFKVSIHIFRI